MRFKLIFCVYNRVQGMNTMNKSMLRGLRDLQAGKEENKNGYLE